MLAVLHVCALCVSHVGVWCVCVREEGGGARAPWAPPLDPPLVHSTKGVARTRYKTLLLWYKAIFKQKNRINYTFCVNIIVRRNHQL